MRRFGSAIVSAAACGMLLGWHPAVACESPRNRPSDAALRARSVVAGRCVEPDVCRAADPAEVGEWRLLAGDTEVLAVHAALLPTGRVLLMAGSANDHNYRAGADQTRLFDPDTETVIGAPAFAGAHVPPGDPPTLHDTDVFCAGHSFLPDGRLLVVGGNLEYPTGWVHRTPGVRADMQHAPGAFDHPLPYDNPGVTRPSCHGFLGLRDSFLFDAATGTWQRGPKMARGRWYPSTQLLADGRVLAINGFDWTGTAARCNAKADRLACRP